MPSSLVGIFAKHWTPGEVKTRLGEGIGLDRAAAFYRGSVETLLERMVGLGDEQMVCYWPPERASDFVGLRPGGWKFEPQTDGDLGQRIRAFFQQAFEAGVDRVVLLGSDIPNVPVKHVVRALELLNEHRLVLGPTEDRGYYLVGAYRKIPPIFGDMPWSTPELWPATLRQLDAEGWQRGVDYELVPTWYDIDTLDDLKRLHRELLVESVGDDVLTQLLAYVEAALDYKYESEE